MSLIEHIIRPEVRHAHAYPVADASGFIKLDAMENPYPLPIDLQKALAEHLSRIAIHRYPLPSYTQLKQKICEKLGVPNNFGVVLGNGSDELIGMICTACAKPNATLLTIAPGFVMYEIAARYAGMRFIGMPLAADFSLDRPAFLKAIAQHRPALIFLAYPNNPTGNLFAEEDIEAILQAAGEHSLVVIDEAYQPFAQTSLMPWLAQKNNLLVLRTVSKLGLAGIRLGYMSAAPDLLAEFEKVRPPYNINVLTEAAALFALDHLAVFEEQARLICQEREKLRSSLQRISGVEVFPSAANFLLVRVPDGDALFKRLLAQKILVKNSGAQHPLLANCLRITVGSPQQNTLFLQAFASSSAGSL